VAPHSETDAAENHRAVAEDQDFNSRCASEVAALIEEYSDPDGSAAWFLCDRHEPSSVAFRIVPPDLAATVLTYGELRELSERLASSLAKLGIRSGDRVATLMGKSRDHLVALVAIWRLGAVQVPLFTAFAPPAIAMRLTGSGARAVICDAGQSDKLRPSADIPDPPPWTVIAAGGADGALDLGTLIRTGGPGFAAARVGPEAPLIHIYTSGTTGAPKGVVVPLRMLAAVRAYARFGLDLRADDIYWCAADPGWAYGLYYGILGPLATGVPGLLLEGGFSTEATIAVLERFGVTNFAAAPTIYRALRAALLDKPDLQLRCASSAGEPLTSDVNAWAIGALGVEVRDHYGQTETGMLVNNHHHAALKEPLRPGSMGRAMPGWSASVLREGTDVAAAPGEIGRLAMDLKASPLAWFPGYAGDERPSLDKFSANRRWYITGDLAKQDEDGLFYFSSREDDVILMAGYRIGPSEIEATINAHPGVAESAVIAMPDEIRGEVIEAYVVPASQVDTDSTFEYEIQQWVKTRYAAHAYPRRVHIVAEIPKTPSGKIQRFLLRQRLKADSGAAQ
jgi:acetyl-CoA synthetase